MPQKENNDIWVEGVEPPPKAPIGKSKPQPRISQPKAKPLGRTPNIAKSLAPKMRA